MQSREHISLVFGLIHFGFVFSRPGRRDAGDPDTDGPGGDAWPGRDGRLPADDGPDPAPGPRRADCVPDCPGPRPDASSPAHRRAPDDHHPNLVRARLGAAHAGPAAVFPDDPVCHAQWANPPGKFHIHFICFLI